MKLPRPETLAATWKAAAAFDAIVNFDDWYGYYTWWPKHSKGLVDNGLAKQVWGLFGPPGCVLVGFSIDSALSCFNRADHSLWPGLFDGLPGQLDALIMQSGIDRQRCTFCMWWTAEQQVWSRGSVEIPPGGDDGSEEILGYITVDSRGFKLWADEYYESDFDLQSIDALFSHRYSDGVILSLNPEVDVEAIKCELMSFGFQCA